MKSLSTLLTYLTVGTAWIAGIVIANGFWSTLFALFFPLWAWYLVVEKMLHVLGWV